MGYAFEVSACIGCKTVFAYSPVYVPSLVVNGEKEPVCHSCFQLRQEYRKEHGLEEEPLDPRAYEAIAEELL